jgi:hypothetical protein
MARLHRELGMESDHWKEKADGLRAAILKNFWSDDLDLFVDNPGSDHASIAANALAVCLGLSDTIEEAVSLIRREGAACSTLFVPYVVEACFLTDEHQLAIDLMSFVEDFSRDPSPLYLIPRHVFGVSPDSAGWGTIEVTPSLVRTAESALLEVPLPLGRLRFSYTSENGAQITIPVGSRVTLDAPEGMSVVVKKYRSHTMPESLSEEARAVLDASGWGDRAGDDAFIWVSIDEQILRIMRGETIEYESRCASAEKGIGSLMNSFKTPLGWHSVAKKIGDDAPWGQVFKSRIATREIWQPGENVSEDMVLSRILLLNGEESGLNKGGKVDSFARNIYIHGTNDEARIGVPSSHGCIRMLNDDVIEIYGMVGEGMLVLITGTEEDLEREDA